MAREEQTLLQVHGKSGLIGQTIAGWICDARHHIAAAGWR